MISSCYGNLIQEEEQIHLEAEMQKRRERIERWRADRKRKEIDQAKKEVQKGSIVTSIQLPISKKWSLEDDSGDEAVMGKGMFHFPEVCIWKQNMVLQPEKFMCPCTILRGVQSTVFQYSN